MKIRNREKRIMAPGVRSAAIYALYINVLLYLLVLVMFFYGRSAVIPSAEEHAEHPPFAFSSGMFLFGIAWTYVYIFSLFCINFLILKHERLEGAARTIVSIAASLLFIIAWNQLSHLVQTTLFDFPKADSKVLRGSIMRDFILGGTAVFSAQLMYLSYRRQQISIENEALKAEYERARYETLKNQIDPHFLFNTLNTLNSVISLDQQKAQQYVQKLSSILRYTMQTRDVTTLEEELNFTRDYCDLMRIRYGENLSFVFDIAPEYKFYSVVPFGIQTLVENAIKHNVITNRQPLTVTIRTEPDDCVVVSNPVNPRRETESGDGIGLANLSERYRLRWGRDVGISADGGVFSVRLPMVRDIQTLNADKDESCHCRR